MRVWDGIGVELLPAGDLVDEDGVTVPGDGDARKHEDTHRGDVGEQHGGCHVHDDAGQDGG